MSTCVHTYRNDTPLVSRAKQEDRQTGMRRMYTLVLILETCFHLFILTSNIEIFMIICDHRSYGRTSLSFYVINHSSPHPFFCIDHFMASNDWLTINRECSVVGFSLSASTPRCYILFVASSA